MVRAVLATAAALLLVGVLSLLIVESRAVKEVYYIAHAERLRAIESSRKDIDAVIQGTKGAFDEGRAIPSSITLAFASLTTNLKLLQNPTEPAVADSIAPQQLVAYDEQLQQFIRNGQAFAARQNALAEALRMLQEESPNVVKDLRRLNLRIESQNAFSLAIEVIEFVMGRGQSSPEQLVGRIAELRNDKTIDTETPGRLDTFLDAASTVIAEHTAGKAALAEIGNSSVTSGLSALAVAVLDDNRRIVSRAERARLLLAVCAVLLLLGVGFATFRLQNSYRALNKSNAKLEKLNDSLEQRVIERTEELSHAYEELKESQVQLVQAEKMSSLGELVAGISHEINTPLWYLMSNSAVIQERLIEIGEFLDIAEKMVGAAKSRAGVREAVSAGLVDMNKMLAAGMKEDIDEAKDLVQDSIEGLEELTELVQSLKDFSRLDRAKQGDFNVNEGLNKTLLIIKNKIKDKVTVHKHFGEVPNILCSPSQINQVFLNLIGNASDAIAKQGDVVLHTWAKDGKVGIRVADTGCGIPEEYLSKVRDPFFTTKEVGKGTGLGLSIVDQIVTAHHGELTIESVLGKGTTITVLLPIKPPAENPVQENTSDSTPEAATPAKASAATAPVVEQQDADANWAGDSNEVAEHDAPVSATASHDADVAADDWAGDTNVSAVRVVTDESAAASNDDSGSGLTNAAEEVDWAGDTNVANAKVVAADAENDAEAVDPAAAAAAPATEANFDQHAETDISEFNDDADPYATTSVAKSTLMTEDYVESGEATVVAVRSIENEVMQMFARSGSDQAATNSNKTGSRKEKAKPAADAASLTGEEPPEKSGA
jgi:signal transduction histidine kinase